MGLKKGLLPIVIVHTVALITFTVIFLLRKNYEFMSYIGLILIFMSIVLFTYRKVKYTNGLLWLLAIWSMLHMAGGGVSIAGTRLYDYMVVEIVGAPYYILKMDQLIHMYGFFVATLVFFHVIKPLIRKNNTKFAALSIVLFLSGIGAGALNEVIEFTLTVFVPNTGVGGFENTGLDLISNSIGALAAIFTLRAGYV